MSNVPDIEVQIRFFVFKVSFNSNSNKLNIIKAYLLNKLDQDFDKIGCGMAGRLHCR